MFNRRVSRKQVAMVTPKQSVHYTRNSLNYPFPSELMKTTQSDIIVVIGRNAGPNRVQIPNGISIGSAVFAQLMAERRYTLQ